MRIANATKVPRLSIISHDKYDIGEFFVCRRIMPSVSLPAFVLRPYIFDVKILARLLKIKFVILA